MASILCGDVCSLHCGVPPTPSNSLLRGSHVLQWLHPLISFSNWRVACMPLFMAQRFSTHLSDVLSSSVSSVEYLHMALKAM